MLNEGEEKVSPCAFKQGDAATRREYIINNNDIVSNGDKKENDNGNNMNSSQILDKEKASTAHPTISARFGT